MSSHKWFFRKKGRPTSEQAKLLKTIFNLIENDGEAEVHSALIKEYIDHYGVAEDTTSLRVMTRYLQGKVPFEDIPGMLGIKQGKSSQSAQSSDESSGEFESGGEVEGGDDDFESSEESNSSIEDVEFEELDNSDYSNYDPFSQPVVERDYTDGHIPGGDTSGEYEGAGNDDVHSDEGGDVNLGATDSAGSINEDDDVSMGGEEFDDIPPASFSSDDDEEDDEAEFEEDEDGGGGALGGGNLDDLTPAQKKKAAQKTADSLLDMYCRFAPLPFKKWAKFSENKVQKLVYENRLDLGMMLENDVTVGQFIDSTNEQVDDTFEVDEETREEIREPLIEVLLEQELALTPTQRLLFAVGSHVVQMGMSAYSLAQNNKMALEAFQQYHMERLEAAAPPPQTGTREQPVDRTPDQSPPTSSGGSPSTPPPTYSEEITDDERSMAKNVISFMEEDDDILTGDSPNVEITEED